MITNKADILAPGGDEEAVRAAILAGADAVYLGLSKFNARMKAANISEESLPSLVHLAHSRGVKIYVTLNTLITTGEVKEFLALVRVCQKAGVDALIIQDLGALYLLQKLYPELRTHASTQTTSHNSGQIEFLKRLGVRQVNLCREMSLSEIRELTEVADRMGIKTEVFVHGAYCISFSGQCLMSSFIGGQSANRGLCAQPCRRLYYLRPGKRDGAYRLSLKDNSAFKKAASLLEAGVKSFKIEGRLKNFFYVYQTVRAWREQMDRILAGLAPNEDDPRLHEVFNRGFSAGYLESRIGRKMFVTSPLDQSLPLVGEVKGYLADRRLLELTESAELPRGARINIYSPDNRFICTAVVENKQTANAFKILPEHRMRDKIVKGHLVCLLRDSEKIANLQAELRQMKECERLPLWVKLEGREGQRLRASFSSGQKIVLAESSILLQKAAKNPLTQEAAFSAFSRLGGTAFELKGVDCSSLADSLFLPVSELNALRRKAISQLEKELWPDSGEKLPPPLPPGGAESVKTRLVILVSEPDEAAIFSSLLTSPVLLEINSAEDFQKAAPYLANHQNILPFFSAILFEREFQRLAKILDAAICSKVVVNNSGLGLLATEKGIRWVAGPALNCTNPYTARALREKGGAEGVFLSPELNLEQLKEASRVGFDLETWLTILGPILLMTTRQCLLRDTAACGKEVCDEHCLGSCHQYAVWYDERNMPFYVYKRPGTYTQIFNNAILLAPEAILHQLRGRISYFVLDMRNFPFYHLSREEKRMILDYLTAILDKGTSKNSQGQDQHWQAVKRILSPTTSGHLKRGL
ncbi:MAG: U32 family peptidase [bacterium]|nr:U32 family peptidase [bacterium]